MYRSIHLTMCFFAVFLLGLPVATPAQTVRGSDQPWTRHTIDSSSRGADGVRLADANDDGRTDIVTGWEEGSVVQVYLHPGTGKVVSQWPRVVIGTVESVEDAVFMDVDENGTMDVVSAAEGDNSNLFVHRAPAPERYMDPDAWTTEPIPAAAERMQWMFTLPVQIDNHGGTDLAAAGKEAGAQIGWFQIPAPGESLDAWRWHDLSAAGWIMSLVAIDMDGDGDEDLLLTDRRGPMRGVRWLEHPGPEPASSRPWKNHFVGGRGHEVMFMTAADLDLDGSEDILAATRSDTLLYFRRVGDGAARWESVPILLPKNTGTGKAVAVGDIDGDGRPDIVFSCENAGDRSGLMWLERDSGTSMGRWTAHEVGGIEGTKFDLVQLMDLDADGDLDVLTCEEREGLGVVWYENPNR